MKVTGRRIVLLGVLPLLLFWLPSAPLASPQGSAVKFLDMTESVIKNGKIGQAEQWGVIAVGDFDGTGWDGFYIGHHGAMDATGDDSPTLWPRGGQLFRNNGNGTFTEVSHLLPVVTADTQHRHVAVWCDLNRKGREDLIIATGMLASSPTAHADLWLHNNGNGTFTNIAESLGTIDRIADATAITCADIDGSGYPSVFMLARGREDLPPTTQPVVRLWVNHAGQSFTEEATARGLWLPSFSKEPYSVDCAFFGELACAAFGNNVDYWFLRDDGNFHVVSPEEETFPIPSPYLRDVAWADFNGSGKLGVAILDGFKPEDANPILRVYCNNGNSFDTCFTWTKPKTDDSEDYRALAVGDFDNSGAPSIFVLTAGGLVIDGNDAKDRDYLFMNNGKGQFTDRATPAGLNKFVGTRFGAGGVAIIDYDMDGRLDLIVGYNSQEHPGPFRIYRNVTNNGNSWVGFRLKSSQPLGSWVTVKACDRQQVTQLTARTGWLHQHSRVVHFGLGKCKKPVQVTVHWPNGKSTTATVSPKHYYTVWEGNSITLFK